MAINLKFTELKMAMNNKKNISKKCVMYYGLM